MKYIQKSKGPDCLSDIAADMPWREFGAPCREELKESLYSEQNGTCAYCERQLRGGENKSEVIEHMIPQGTLSGELRDAIERNGISADCVERRRYWYENIVLSCFGYPPPADNHEKPDQDNVSCDEHKRGEIDIDFFLFPTRCENIADCFYWESETGAVSARVENGEKASYTIDLLNLDYVHLREARRNSLEALVRIFSAPDGEEILERRMNDIRNGECEFSSFLNFVL